MTERLYYNEPYLREFDATVVEVTERDERVIVTLDRTAFYPTSGGQPFDTGTLGAFRIVDVLDENGGAIEHVLAVHPYAVHAERAAEHSRPAAGEVSHALEAGDPDRLRVEEQEIRPLPR